MIEEMVNIDACKLFYRVLINNREYVMSATISREVIRDGALELALREFQARTLRDLKRVILEIEALT